VKHQEAERDVTEVMLALTGVLGQEAGTGQNELPLGSGDVAGVGLVSDHALNYVVGRTKVHNML
jgi:hypothetical protein